MPHTEVTLAASQKSTKPRAGLDLLVEGGRQSTLRIIPVLVGPLFLIAIFVAFMDPTNAIARVLAVSAPATYLYVAAALWLGRRVTNQLPIMLMNSAVFASAITALLFGSVIISNRPGTFPTIYSLYLVYLACSALTNDNRVVGASLLMSMVGYTAWATSLEFGWMGTPTAEVVANQTTLPGHLARLAVLGAVGFSSALSASRGMDLHRLSMQDGLTGVLNRHAFDHCLRMQAKRSEELGRPLSIAMIDVDSFKALNDEHGHAVGDEVLRWLALNLEQSVRGSDLVTRYGGDEFVVAFLDTDHERLDERLEELQHRIRTADFRSPSGDPVSISVSIGVARVPREAEAIDRALETADRRLYAAKRLGRDRLVASDPEDGTQEAIG